MSHDGQLQMLTKIFILLENTEDLKPQQLEIFHKLFGAGSPGLRVSRFLLSHLGDKEEAGMKNCSAAKAVPLQHLGP